MSGLVERIGQLERRLHAAIALRCATGLTPSERGAADVLYRAVIADFRDVLDEIRRDQERLATSSTVARVT